MVMPIHRIVLLSLRVFQRELFGLAFDVVRMKRSPKTSLVQSISVSRSAVINKTSSMDDSDVYTCISCTDICTFLGHCRRKP
jgi:hypothetical protein